MARDVVRSRDVPTDEQRAIGFVGDWCFDNSVCHIGTCRIIACAFELDDCEARLAMAANCGDRAVERLAEERNLDPVVATALARSASPEIRGALAGNESLPQHLIDELLVDPDSDVRRRAEWNPTFGRSFVMPTY